MGLLEWAAPIADLAGNLITNFINARNVEKTNKQNEALQREEWAREDSAVQRRMEDLKNAGLNPILAGGDGAGSSLAVRMGAPQFADPGVGSAIERGIRANNARQQMALTQAQLNATLPKLQFEGAIWSALNSDPTNALKFAQLEKDKRELDWRERNALVGKAIADSDNARKQGKLLDINYELTKRWGDVDHVTGMLGDVIGGVAGWKNAFNPAVRTYRRE